MRLFDLFARSRSRRAPRSRLNRVRCAVEMLELRLALSTTGSTSILPPPILPPPPPPPVIMIWTLPINGPGGPGN
jgi:hypothetical protein